MKELSVEEMAKAYAEAIERYKARQEYECQKVHEFIEYLFPVLKESKENEDERIKNEIIAFIEQSIHRGGGTPIPQEQENKWLAWLEKQGKQKIKIYEYEKPLLDKFKKLVYDCAWGKVTCTKEGETQEEYASRWAELLLNYVREWADDYIDSREELIKRHAYDKDLKQIHVDKVKPKFKVGDWIIRNNEHTCIPVQVIEFKGYYICDLNGEMVTFTLNDVHNDFHLWTIQDAKDGDVLACESGWTCIFKSLNDGDTFSSYCFMDRTKSFFETGSECHTLNKEFMKAYNGEIKPSTKEQRDLLFQKMKEAGYEWDAEKKELKKIDQKSDEWSKEDENILATIIEEGYLKPSERQWLKSLKDRIQSQPKQGWNYNDEIIIETITQEIERIPSEKFIDNAKCRCLDWLKYRIKSLKPQKRWKPSSEQIATIEYIIKEYESTTIHLYDGAAKQLYSLLEQLKQL